MPFRCRQRLVDYASYAIMYRVGQPNPDTGIVDYREVAQNGFSAKLPDVEMTDLRSCLKAGVSLEKVNCKLIDGDVRPLMAAIAGDVKNEATSSEVKNEE